MMMIAIALTLLSACEPAAEIGDEQLPAATAPTCPWAGGYDARRIECDGQRQVGIDAHLQLIETADGCRASVGWIEASGCTHREEWRLQAPVTDGLVRLASDGVIRCIDCSEDDTCELGQRGDDGDGVVIEISEGEPRTIRMTEALALTAVEDILGVSCDEIAVEWW